MLSTRLPCVAQGLLQAWDTLLRRLSSLPASKCCSNQCQGVAGLELEQEGGFYPGAVVFHLQLREEAALHPVIPAGLVWVAAQAGQLREGAGLHPVPPGVQAVQGQGHWRPAPVGGQEGAEAVQRGRGLVMVMDISLTMFLWTWQLCSWLT